jgi:aerobic carbon-monoxide dehydrogenase large subunit
MIRVTADKLNGVPCARGIVGRGGKPMKEPPHPLLARGKVRRVGDPVAMVSPTASMQARRRRACCCRIPYPAGGDESRRGRGALRYGDVPVNLCRDWGIGAQFPLQITPVMFSSFPQVLRVTG